MTDDFEKTFVVEIAPADVWQRLIDRTMTVDGQTHYVLPGFPSMEPLPIDGASCSPIEVEPERLLRLSKDHWPCAGTEIIVELESVESGTKIRVVQSGFGAFIDFAGRDTVFRHGEQIVDDLRLFIERGLTVPGTAWGVSLGAVPRQTPVGLELTRIDGGFAEAAGLEVDDLLLTLRGVRIHDLQQLWTVLALTEGASRAEVTVARGRERVTGSGVF